VAPPSPLLAVQNVTDHPSTASVPTLCFRCGTIITFAHLQLFPILRYINVLNNNNNEGLTVCGTGITPKCTMALLITIQYLQFQQMTIVVTGTLAGMASSQLEEVDVGRWMDLSQELV